MADENKACEGKMRRRDAYVDSLGNWLGEFPWQFFGTLTFAKHNVAVWQAKHLFAEFVRFLGDGVFYFVVFEHCHFSNVVHIHFLLGGTMEKLDWRYGVSEVVPYDKTRGARFYLSKFLKSGKVDWDFSSNLKQIGGSIMDKKRLTPIRAIRAKCLKDCSSGQRKEVKLCPITDCALYEFRFGKNPLRAGKGGRRKMSSAEN